MSCPQQSTINWPSYRADQVIPVQFRVQMDDFKVVEDLDQEFSHCGEHFYLFIEKTNKNTPDVQRLLADHYRVPLLDVSYSGLKDKRAVAQQWFSVRLPKTTESFEAEGVKVLEQYWHRHKLRRGTHSSNRFSIVLRSLPPDRTLPTNLLTEPFPNYFGPQRFGVEYRNLHRARAWVKAGRPPVARPIRGRHLSTLRSFLFNEVLAERVLQGNWRSWLPGDCSVDKNPTGPLWGRGQLPTTEQTLKLDSHARSKHPELCEALEWVGLRQDRRALAVTASGVNTEQSGSTLRVQFSLPKGSFATVGLAQYFDCQALAQ